MAISYSSISSAVQAGSTSVLYRAPASLVSTDLILWAVANKYPGATPDTPSGLTALLSQSGGPGGTGADTGDVVASAFYRVSDGTEDGATETVAITGGNCSTSRSVSYSRSAGTGWAIASSYGQQNTEADIWSVTSVASLDVAAGDVIVVVVAKNSDADTTHNTVTLTGTGLTFGSYTSRHGPTGTTQGDDCMLAIGEFPVTAGSGTVALTYSHDNAGGAGDPAGVVLFIRLREDGAGPTPIAFSGTVPTLTGVQGVAFSEDLSGYFAGSETPFTFALNAGTLPAGLSVSSAGVISGTPTVGGTFSGLVVRGTDTTPDTADSNAFSIALSANPTTDFGYYALAQSVEHSQEHTTAAHSFHHDTGWWTLLRNGTDWGLYEETGNLPGSPGSTVDWVGSAHLASIHSSVQTTVAVDSANNKAYVLGFGAGATVAVFRVLTYAAGAWTVTQSFNLTGTGGVGLGTTTTFSNQDKLSIGVDPNGVPYVVAGNKGLGASATDGVHFAWPDSAASLGGTWSSVNLDSNGGTPEADASGMFAGVVSQGGTDYLVVAYTDHVNELTRMAWHAVETTLSNYSTGWTLQTIDATVSVDNHVWARVYNDGSDQVLVTMIKGGDGAAQGRIYVLTSRLGASMTWTHKRHRVTNGPGEAGALLETPSRPVGVLDETNGNVYAVYHAKDSHPYQWVGYKVAAMADLLASSSDTDVFDSSVAENNTPLIYDASFDATWNAKAPAHAVDSSMGYAPITALVSSGASTGDSVWWARVQTSTAPTLSDLKAVNVTATTVQGTYDYAF